MNNAENLPKEICIKNIKQCVKSGVVFLATMQLLFLGINKKTLELVRLSMHIKCKARINKRYKKIIHNYKSNLNVKDLKHERSNVIWVCWFQGMENAPDIVYKCYQSLKKNIKNKQIIVLTEKNYSDYINFPNHIWEKIKNGKISKTHLSDLIRLELLITYGGTWIDATVYCSGENIPNYMLESDLFLFQNLKPGLDGHPTCISSWFITAVTNNPILLLTRELLYEYWKKNNSMINYFLLHFFFQLAIEAYPDEWDKVIPFNNSTPHILLLRLFDEYNKELWEEVTRISPFHKLTYKFENIYQDSNDLYKENTYYKNIV